MGRIRRVINKWPGKLPLLPLRNEQELRRSADGKPPPEHKLRRKLLPMLQPHEPQEGQHLIA